MVHTDFILIVLKTTKPDKHQKPLKYRELNSNKKFCVVACRKEYVSRAELIRKNLEGKKGQLILFYALSP